MRGLLALLLLAFAAPLAAQAPLLTSHLRIHDPWVVADTDSQTYWLFSRNDPSVTGDKRLGIMAYVSRDLAHWEKPRIVFTLPDGTWANEGAWAPEVHRWKGRWYLLATFHNEGAAIRAKAKRQTYRRTTLLAVSDRLDGPFALVRSGDPIAPTDAMTLDGTLHVDAAGKPWLVYAHEWMQVGKNSLKATSFMSPTAPNCSARRRVRC